MAVSVSRAEAQLLARDQPAQPWHQLSVLVVEGPPPAASELGRLIAQRIGYAPRFRQKLAGTGLQALRELGCKIAIDDFGTGQSSLDYIRRFPADRIKIDQVFVRNIGVDPDDEAIVRRPACELKDDTDLGDRPVTVQVGPLSPAKTQSALERGARYAQSLMERELITQAMLSLQGRSRIVVPSKQRLS